MQRVGNKAMVFCIFQAYNRLSMHQVIFIVVRSSDRGDLVENQIPRTKNLIPLFEIFDKAYFSMINNRTIYSSNYLTCITSYN